MTRMLTFVALPVLALQAGCYVNPRKAPQADVGGPAVFTMLHVQTARATSDAFDARNGAIPAGSVRDDLLRYFRSKNSDYVNGDIKLRGDTLLDGTQMAQSIAQLASTSVKVQGELNWLKFHTDLPKPPLPDKPADTPSAGTTTGTTNGTGTAAATGSGATTKDPAGTASGGGAAASSKGAEDKGKAAAKNSTADAGDGAKDETAKPDPKAADAKAESPMTLPSLTKEDSAALASALSAIVSDSPFDQLERVYNFSSLLHLKLLEGYGRDSRVLSANQLFQSYANTVLRAARAMVASAAQRKSEAEQLLARIENLAKQERDHWAVADKDIEAAREALTRLTGQTPLTAASSMASALPMVRGLSGIMSTALVIERSSVPVDTATPSAQEGAGAAHDRRTASLQELKTTCEHFIQDTTRANDALATEVGGIPEVIADANKRAAASPPATETAPDRLLYVIFPVSVSPGTYTNFATGVRIRITGATFAAGAAVPSRWENVTHTEGAGGLVRVIALQPTRTYDLKSELFVDLARSAVTTALSANVGTDSVSTPSVKGSFESEDLRELEARNKFLSRMAKQGAFLDAQNHEFGWNFMPSNVQLLKADWWEFWRASKYSVTAKLDVGSYDCGAYLLVPRDLTSFTYSTDYVFSRLDDDGTGGAEHRYHKLPGNQFLQIKQADLPDDQRRHVVVTLPPYSTHEEDVATGLLDQLSSKP